MKVKNKCVLQFKYTPTFTIIEIYRTITGKGMDYCYSMYVKPSNNILIRTDIKPSIKRFKKPNMYDIFLGHDDDDET